MLRYQLRSGPTSAIKGVILREALIKSTIIADNLKLMNTFTKALLWSTLIALPAQAIKLESSFTSIDVEVPMVRQKEFVIQEEKGEEKGEIRQDIADEIAH